MVDEKKLRDKAKEVLEREDVRRIMRGEPMEKPTVSDLLDDVAIRAHDGPDGSGDAPAGTGASA